MISKLKNEVTFFYSRIEEKQILIKHEQGFGDTIQFSRLIPELKRLVSR